MSPAIVALLIQLQVLLVFARHWLGLLRQAAERGALLLARCFGSAQASFVLTNLTRGILRAIALEHVLLARAAGEPAVGQPEPHAGTPRKRSLPARPSALRPPHGSHDRRPVLPTLRQLEAAIRRRPLDGVIDDINRELGAAFSLCGSRFGNALHDVLAAYRDTLSNLFHEFPQREAAVAGAPEQNPAFDYPPRKPDAIRYIVGCLCATSPSVVSHSPPRRLARPSMERNHPDSA